MRRTLTLLAIALAHPAFAAPFSRPIPQAQSATAELSFAIAAVALIVALWVVHKLVTRR